MIIHNHHRLGYARLFDTSDQPLLWNRAPAKSRKSVYDSFRNEMNFTKEVLQR